MPLTSLPNELLTKILEIVNDDCPLTNISLTCKRLNDVAQPLLYGSFWQQNGHNMGEFARAMIKRPSLAGHVKIFGGSTIQPSLKFRDTTRGDINLPGVNNGDLTNEQLQWMRGSLPDAIHGQEFCNAWYDELVDSFDNWDAVLAFLLLICSSHLTFLMLRTAITNSPYVQAVLEQAIKEQHASSHDALLSNLKQVDLEYDTKAGKRGRGMKASFVLPFFRLKSVVDISITGIQNDLALSSIFQEEHISIIKHLTIIDSQISASSMENILRCFTSLQLFEYQHAPQKFDSNTNFIPISIINGLERSKHCLKELHLGKKSLPGYSYETLYPWDEYKPVETLNDFEKLR
jgi:hypothetical protein